MPVPHIFGTQSSPVAAAKLDENFAAMELSSRTIYPENYGMVGDGVTIESPTAVAAFLAALTPFKTAILDGHYKLGAGLVLTNKSNIGIGGKGKLSLANAPSGAFAIQLVGTLDDVLFDGFSIAGDNNTGYSQTGIGNNSGQTLSRIRMHRLNVSGINVGLSLTGNGGTCTDSSLHDCVLKDIIGTGSGQGYGIHIDNAFGNTITENKIWRACRHSIYQARGGKNTIAHNKIFDHRSTVFTGALISALVVCRSSDVQVLHNDLFDFYDGGIEVSHDTSLSLSCSRIQVIGNNLRNRKNSIHAIYIGEQAVPGTYVTEDVRIINNQITESQVDVGPSGPIRITNGNRIRVKNNEYRRTDVDGSCRFVELGLGAYITADDDCQDTCVQNNDIVFEGSVLTDCRVVDIDVDICGNSSRHTIGPNNTLNATSQAYANATLTNTFIDVHSMPVGTVRTTSATMYPVRDNDLCLIADFAGTVTYGLPNAATHRGRAISVRTVTANLVESDSSNVVPRAGGAAGIAILSAVDGAWAELVSDGTAWQIVAGS